MAIRVGRVLSTSLHNSSDPMKKILIAIYIFGAIFLCAAFFFSKESSKENPFSADIVVGQNLIV